MTNQMIELPTSKVNSFSFNFNLPDQLQCAKPTEVRGIARDQVRLMVSNKTTNNIEHTIFRNIHHYLQEGDVLVVNTSGTLKAALEAYRSDGTLLRVHFSTKLSEKQWIVELRQVVGNHTERFRNGLQGETLQLTNGGTMFLKTPYYSSELLQQEHLQLWEVDIQINDSVENYLDSYGMPIRYNYVKDQYPQSYYQTIFAKQMGSTEMPSAGRGFTAQLLTQLIINGVQILPIVLHTGVASLEINERPYQEYYQVPQPTASALNLARQQNRRIIAVGTTVVRALETVTDCQGFTQGGTGWTDEFITPERGIFAVNGLLTGFHEPKASHLLMLETLAGREHIEVAYQAAIEETYQWHEFGDLHLIID
ncbi:MAG: S-adenosylmethionine:tRNA ribosyltransferase-isomerase [Chitinophagales bacterium]